MSEIKKIDIYSLYKKEKKIVIEDDEGNSVEILLVKIPQGQRAELLREYTEFLDEERVRLRAREDRLKSLALSLKNYNKEEFIAGIIAFERAQRTEIADLYPLLEGKDEAEKKRLLEEEFKKFEELRRTELLKKTEEELRAQFVDLTVESQALIEAARTLNFKSLALMCLDPESREPIFKNISDVERITDRRTMDKLIEEMLKFRALETIKEVRKAATEQSFLQSGESQKNSTDSPALTK